MLRTKFAITFIPVWLENTMARTGMNFSDALNKEKLLSILSKSDVVFYLLANNLFRDVYLNGPVLESGMISSSKLDRIFCNDSDINNEVNIHFGTMLNKHITSLSQEQLFLQHALGESVDIQDFKDLKFTFVAQVIDEENIVVRFKLLENEVPLYKFFGNFYEQLLRTLNFHYPFHEIARTALFGKYCRFIGMGINK